MTVDMTQTPHAYWKCGGPLFKLEPPVDGWRYHGKQCQHLTSPQGELEAALVNTPDGSVGIVSAVPCRMVMAKV
jgi:hypothetical protein